MRDAKNGIRPDRSAVAGDDWMSWVSFGTGIGSMGFGFLALLFAMILASSYFIWIALVLAALVLAGAAITFAMLHKNKSGAATAKARMGMLFGIIGGGLAFIALIVWIIRVAAGASPVFGF